MYINWLEKYKAYLEVVSRIMDYISRKKNVVTMTVLSYKETNLNTRSELKSALGKFVGLSHIFFKVLKEQVDTVIRGVSSRLHNKQEWN